MDLINRMMKRPLLLALVLVLAAPLVHANPGGGRGGNHQGGQGGGYNNPQRQPPHQRDFQREEPQRFQRRDEGNAGEQQRQRLSPDERRQLRRDIHDAGRDIYPQRR